MKKARIFAFVLLLCSVAYLEPQGMDIVVMVDTSASMFPYFDDLRQYLLEDILITKLNPGDGFHLLSFDNSPRTEMQTVIEDSATLGALVRRLGLLYPLGRYTDLVAAIEMLLAYVEQLPEPNSKLVLLLTDGIHDPPPDSPNVMGAAEVQATLLQSARRIKREGWSVHILQMPGSFVPGAGGEQAGEPALEPFAAELGGEIEVYEGEEKETLAARLTGIPTVTFPSALGSVGRRFRVQFRISNPRREALSFRVVGLSGSEGDLLARPVSVTVDPEQTAEFTLALKLPGNFPPGPRSLMLELVTADPPTRLSPSRGELSFTYSASQTRDLLWLLLILGALVLIVIARLLLLLVRKLQELSFAGVFAEATRVGTGHRGGRQSGLHRPLIMRVVMQNSRIGSRNIHQVPRGGSRSVGGDGSKFLIYYLPMPKRIGDIKNDNDRYIFIPRKTEYFPTLDGPVPDCLGRRIEVLSKHGQVVTFYFEQFISPLEEINRLMRSIRPQEMEED